jgi:hypothetical protein
VSQICLTEALLNQVLGLRHDATTTHLEGDELVFVNDFLRKEISSDGSFIVFAELRMNIPVHE